jgi:hypothetical protein
MPHYDLAQIHEQDTDLIIVPIDDAIRTVGNTEKNILRDELQVRARSAGLAGTVCLVWDAGDGRLTFLAPRNYAPFFRTIDLDFVLTNLNHELAW